MMRRGLFTPARLAVALLLSSATASTSAWAVASAELSTTQSYLYGRFEARIRFAPGDGIVSSFFLWKNGSEQPGTFWNELDFEKVAADCHMTTNARFGNPSANHSQTNALNVDICGSYHDYRFEWTPTYIAWSVDGQEFRRDTDANATAFSQNATAGMQFHFNVWPGNSTFGGNFNASILPVHEYISWVQYASFANGTFTPVWKEEFDAGTLPSGWVLGNFASPFNLSTHSQANVAFVSGIAVLSVTADNATGAPGVPPPDPSATTGAGGTPATGAGGTAGGGGTGGAANIGSGGASATGAGGSGGPSPGTGGSAAGSGGATGSSGDGGATGSTSGSGGQASTGTGGGAGPGEATNSSSGGGCSCSLSPATGCGSAVLPLGVVLFFGLGRRRRS